MTASETIEQRLAAALAECGRLREKNRQLRDYVGLVQIETLQPQSPNSVITPLATVAVTAKSSSEEKIRLFRNLFRGREDVYAVRWEGRNGKTGYSPACRKVWGASFRKKPYEPKEYFPLTDQVIQNHLIGKLTAGVYPLLTDETCWFLAADFDKASWQDDVRAFLETCREWNVPAAIERKHQGVHADRPTAASASSSSLVRTDSFSRHACES